MTDLRAEFDQLADAYREQHRANVAITGEPPEYFADYKIADLARLVTQLGVAHRRILDFGCGIGNSVPAFRRHFSESALTCADVSERSIALARQRFPGHESYVQVAERIPLPTASQHIVFSACVFHHIPHEQHGRWLTELLRVTCSGGLLAIYEHNPFNPLTLYAVNTCPLDVNAKLVRAGTMRVCVEAAGWHEADAAYKLFFPAVARKLRSLEPLLEWLALGAQYRLTARKAP